MTKPLVRRLLPGLVSMIHECGSLVLLEGVETEEQTLMAIDAGVDFVQGYFFARPAKELRCSAENKDENDIALFPGLCGKYRQYIHDSQARHKKRLEQYTYDFDIAAREHAFNGSPDVFSDILSKSGVERFYVLDRDGSQVGETLYPDGHEMTYKTRFGYVGNGEGSTWFRRHYFRRAIAEPGKLHNSRPYLSMTGGIICKTLSLCLTTTEGDIRVYCCDIDWTEG
jgi:hypothetical protein